MTPDCVPGAEVDLAALQCLRDALGAETVALLVGECAQDLEEACAALSNPSVDADTIQKLAHKMAGLLGQYACPDAAAFARGLANGGADAALAARERLVERAGACIRELQALATT